MNNLELKSFEYRLKANIIVEKKWFVFFYYLQGSLLDALYWQQTDVAAYDDTQVKMLLQGSRLLGSPRLRMLKVIKKKLSCITLLKKCYSTLHFAVSFILKKYSLVLRKK